MFRLFKQEMVKLLAINKNIFSENKNVNVPFGNSFHNFVPKKQDIHVLHDFLNIALFLFFTNLASEEKILRGSSDNVSPQRSHFLLGMGGLISM